MLTRLLIFLIFSPFYVSGQQEPEFPRGAVLYLSAQQGLNSRFDETPDHYVGGISLAPELTVIKSHLRLGLAGELVRTEKKFTTFIGPRASWRIKTFRIKPMGSLFNFQLQAEHLWGTHHRKLLGGSLGLELFQLLSFRVMAHRDYHYHAWWLRAGLGFNLLHKKRKSPTGSDPMSED